MMQINYITDKPKVVYEHIMPIWRDIVAAEDQRARQAINDYMGYVNPALYPPNEHHIPTMKLFRQITLKVSRDYMALVAKSPYFPIEANNEDEQHIADAVVSLIQTMLERCKYKMHMDMALRLAALNGVSYIFPYWHIKQVKYPIPIDFEKESFILDKEVVLDEFFEQGLGIKVIPAFLGCFDPSAGYDHSRADWFMFRETVSMNKIYEMVKSKELKIKLDNVMGMTPEDAGYEAASDFNRTADTHNLVAIDHVIMPNRYIRVIGQEFVDKNLPYNPWTPGRITAVPIRNEVPPDISMHGGLSDNHIVGRANFLYDMSVNTKFNMMRQALNRITFYDPNKIRNKNDLMSGFGNVFIETFDPENAVNIVSAPTTSPDMLRLSDEIDQLGNDIIGIQPYEYGEAPTPMPQTGVFQGMQAGTSARLAHRYDRFEESLAEFGLNLAIITDRYITLPMVISIIGNQAIDIIGDINDPINMLVIDPRRLVGGYMMGFEASQRANEHKTQLAAMEKYFNLTINDPGLPPIARAQIFKLFTNLSLIGIPKRERNKIIQPFIQMAMMQQQAMLGPQQGAAGGEGQLMLPGPQAQPSQPNSPTSGAAQPRTGQRSAMPGMRIGEPV